MYHNIKVNVVGPMKSGKSQVVKIIEEATAGMGIVVTEQNDQSAPARHRDPAALNELEPPAGGGSGAANCSAGSGAADKQSLNSLSHKDQELIRLSHAFAEAAEKMEEARKALIRCP